MGLKILKRFFYRFAAIYLVIIMLFVSIPSSREQVTADSSVVSLAEIKTTLGLTDLGISDETLEQLLNYPLIEGKILRDVAEVVTVESEYSSYLNGDNIKAALNLIEAVKEIEKFISDSSHIAEIMLTAVGSSTTWLGIAANIMTYAIVIPSIISSFETMRIDWIVRNYLSVATQAKDAEAWEDIRTAFGNAWFYEREQALYTLAQHVWEAQYNQQEITDAARKLAVLIRQRVDIYKAYRSGQYTECVTSSPTTVIVINNGEYPISSVVLGNERPFFPDEVSETYPLIPSSGGKGVMSFVSGVEKINYLEFNVLGARARTDFRTAAVLPIISAPTISSFGDFAPREIAFDASRSIVSQDVTVSDYQWDFGDNSGIQSGITIPHMYQLPGVYQATLTVVTSVGNATATKTISVLNPVSASFTVTPDNGPLSTVFQFSASASATSVGTISSWNWDFGDGSPAGTGAQSAHQYATEGFKTVSLTVTNNYGASSSAGKTVVVGTQQPTNVSGVTAVGADAIWLGNMSDPLIYTAPYRLYDYLTIGADAIWHKEFSSPAIDTQPQHLYDYFTIGADAVWHKTLSNPNIDTVLSKLYDYFAIGADAVWNKSLSSPAIQTTPANQYSFFAVGADAIWGRRLTEPNFSIILGITVIGDIKQNPAAYDGKTVTISGTYRGWEAVHGKPPLTRSDWVIQDSTGSIYVTGSSLGLLYPRDVGKAIEIRGIVRLKSGQPYIELVK